MSGIGELLAGGAVGTLCSELYTGIVTLIGKFRKFKPVLENIQSTLHSLQPLILQIEAQNKKLKLPGEELKNIRNELLKGLNLIHDCLENPVWYKMPKYHDQLVEFDRSLKRQLDILLVQALRDEKTSLLMQTDDSDKPKHRTKFTYSEKWIFFLISLGLETISASFDQLSSPSKPHYALYGMLFAIAAVLICICELIRKGYKERVEFKRWGRIWWYYHPYPPHRLFGNFPDICGLVLAIAQCICSGVQYYYLHRHANNPIKLSILPFMFLLSLGISRCCKD